MLALAYVRCGVNTKRCGGGPVKSHADQWLTVKMQAHACTVDAAALCPVKCRGRACRQLDGATHALPDAPPPRMSWQAWAILCGQSDSALQHADLHLYCTGAQKRSLSLTSSLTWCSLPLAGGSFMSSTMRAHQHDPLHCLTAQSMLLRRASASH